MSGEARRPAPPGLETALGLVLLVGVSVGLALQVAGIIAYWATGGGLAVSREPSAYLTAEGLLGLLADVLRSGGPQRAGLGLMTAGIAILILTPLARVVTSVVYFAARREPKYLVLTLLVLAILVASLALH